MKTRLLHVLAILLAVATLGVPLSAPLISSAWAADACANRGELDQMYCDANKDMVADVPTDAKKRKNPSTIVFTYTPVEDPAVYENIFKPFTTHLAKCLDKKVVFYQVQSNAAEIEAMRSGRLHVGGFSTGPTAFAVNLAGAIPFAVKGNSKEFQGYNLIVIVKANSPYQKLSDLKGKKLAHTSPSSNSGHLAPMALFPSQGLTPDKDYKIIFSGKHDQSVMGVNSGDYDAAAVASDVFHRMAERGQVKEADFRVIYSRPRRSPTRTIWTRHSRTSCCPASTTSDSLPKCKRPSMARTASSRSITQRHGSRCAPWPRVPAAASTRRPTIRKPSGRPTKRRPRPPPRPRNPDLGTPGLADAEAPLQVLRRRQAGSHRHQPGDRG
jgi:phosphonate transport system substrate-binding protein